MKLKAFFSFLLPLLWFASAQFAMPNMAYASISCSMGTSPNISFGTVDGFGSGDTSSADVTWSCSNTDTTKAYVTFCLNIGSGNGGLDGTNRKMISSGKSLDFQLYQNAGNTQIWGSLLSSINSDPRQVQFIIRKNRTYDGSETVYAAIPGGQAGVSSGNYTSSFTGSDAMVSGTYSESGDGYPTNCGTSSAGNFNFTVTAAVVKTCSITATALDFGTPSGLLNVNTDASTTLKATCTSGLPYQIGLDNGVNAVGTTRQMMAGTDSVKYDLYTNTTRSNRWGNTLNVDTLNATGSGSAQTLNVYGRVPVQSTPAAGSYSDTVTVSVYY